MRSCVAFLSIKWRNFAAAAYQHALGLACRLTQTLLFHIVAQPAANDWAIETMHNPRYPLELLLRVITVSLETMKVVNALPALDILQ
jgi:hypothetical protein